MTAFEGPGMKEEIGFFVYRLLNEFGPFLFVIFDDCSTLNEMCFRLSVSKLAVHTRGSFFREVDENALKRSKLKSAHSYLME